MIFHRTWKIDFEILISSISMRSYECMSSIFAFERRKSLLFLSLLWIRGKGDSIQKKTFVIAKVFFCMLVKRRQISHRFLNILSHIPSYLLVLFVFWKRQIRPFRIRNLLIHSLKKMEWCVWYREMVSHPIVCSMSYASHS